MQHPARLLLFILLAVTRIVGGRVIYTTPFNTSEGSSSKEHQLTFSLPALQDPDPLRAIGSLAGHDTGRTFALPLQNIMSDSVKASPNADLDRQWAFEVNRPTRILPHDKQRSCTIVLATKAFAHSYGQPLVMSYSPALLPSHCNDPSQWVFIELTLSGNVTGRQFDRLGSVQLDGVEVLRTDNPEPTRDGIRWTFTKEMNKYYDLWKEPRSLVFDFPNIVNDVYTGILYTALSFSVYTASTEDKRELTLSSQYARIFPLSKRHDTENSFFNVGSDGGDDAISRLRIPQNAKSALVEIYASGTANDEFWYTNIPNRFYEEASSKASQLGLSPRGPLREIQLFIDGRLAGVAYPFPVIFTGGISPFFWRPQVAYGAYDQPSYHIDISPFLGGLTDDAEHEFQLKVSSAEDNQSVLSWFISGNIQIQLDSTDKRTTGAITKYEAPIAEEYTTTGEVGPDFNKTGNLHFQVEGPRTILIEASLQPGSSAEPIRVVWQQNIYFDNTNRLTANSSYTNQLTTGQSLSQHDNQTFFKQDFSYPLTLDSIELNYTLHHAFEQTLLYGQPHLYKEPAQQTVSMVQKGSANMIFNEHGQLVGGTGQIDVAYSYSDSDDYTYSQHNSASNGTVSQNTVAGSLQEKAVRV